MPGSLKSLELHGYKTFAQRTDFIFAEAITAIVGPNGSGKSNIADAIRWVLGEQSYSLLRGKKTEDMIFAGSEQRPRAGMASATIVFDNSNSWLPIDFSEVAITRRAYRDGENEYLINGQRVRLKDVGELLAQSGLAERTYTVIGQGLVDAALALKAEERRRLFEEAAGIGLHRSRREEALKRLDTTKRNLERVEDILAELQPRLRSLERQSRRAQEYEQVKADLHLLLRDWYGYHWHNSQKELTEALEASRRQEAHLEKVRGRQVDLDRELDQVRKKIQALREGLGSYHSQLANLHTRKETLSRDLAVADERLRSMSEQGSSMQSEITRLEGEARYHQERLETASAEIQQLQNETDEAQRQLKVVLQDLQNQKSEREKAEQALQEAQHTLSGHTARQAYLSARLVERKAQVERQESEMETSSKVLRGLELTMQTAETRLQHSNERVKLAEQTYEEVEAGLRIIRDELGKVEFERKQVLDKIGQLQTSAARIKAQLDVIDQAEKNLTGYASGARLLLQAIRQNRLKSQYGSLSHEIEVASEFEKGIAAALGEFLEAIVFPEDGGVGEAFELLDQDTSRGVILPLDTITGSRTVNFKSLIQMEGVLGPAVDFVQSNASLRPVVELLLGNVLLVKDRETARRVLKEVDRKTSETKIVTSQGDVFFASGPILVGQASRAGVLSRPRQRRELKEQFDSLENQISSETVKLIEMDRRISDLSGQENELRRKHAEAEKAKRASLDGQRQEELSLEKARRSLVWQREQHARLEAELNMAAGETSKMAAELKELDEEITRTREVLRIRTQALAERSLDEIQTRVAHWNTQVAVNNQALREAQNRLDERSATVQRTASSLADLQARLEDISKNKGSLAEQKASSIQLGKSIDEEVETLQQKIDPAEAEVGELDHGQSNLLGRDTEARQALSQAEHFYAQARINLARRQEAFESLRGRIEDDFGLVEFKYVETVSGPTPLPLDGFVEQLPFVAEIPPELEENIKKQRAQLRRMGPVNPEAHAEYSQVKERFGFLHEQVGDLMKAEVDIQEIIAELDLLMEREFRKTFDAVAHEFRQIFSRLFGGGMARLVLTLPSDMTETGIDIEARLPGRREQGLSLLSGGERSLTAAALVFALLKVSPTPFCVLDEVDAMLDEANVGRFRDLLQELAQNTQFIVVTHNRNTVQAADVIYGVTMGRDSTSQVISLKLDEVAEVLV
jgi:chromosome segregation protein